MRRKQQYLNILKETAMFKYLATSSTTNRRGNSSVTVQHIVKKQSLSNQNQYLELSDFTINI
jgi:hypothetical protein